MILFSPAIVKVLQAAWVKKTDKKQILRCTL
jgi:hypothetical protein